jgi:hypothetical protein
LTPTPTDKPTETPTITATSTNTRTKTVTATSTWTRTSTNTRTNTATKTNTPTYTYTATATNTFTDTATATNTPTDTATPTDTPTATKTDTDTPTATPTVTPILTESWIEVTYPNGGEVLNKGDIYPITWESSPDVEWVYISVWYEFTCTGCPSGWQEESYEKYQVPNFGTYDWTVNIPNPLNKHFKVSVEGLKTENGIDFSLDRDFSDDPFTVLGPNFSQPVCIAITAEIGYVDDPGNYLGGAINVGNVITGTYIYDSTTADTNSSPTVGDYEHNITPYGITLNAGGLIFRTDPNNVNFLVEIVNDHGSTPRDNYLIRSYNNIFPASVPSDPPFETMNYIAWQLDDLAASALTSTALPTLPPVLADWQSLVGLTIDSQGQGFGGNEYFHIRAHVTSANLCSQTPPATPTPAEVPTVPLPTYMPTQTNTLIPTPTPTATYTRTSTAAPTSWITVISPNGGEELTNGEVYRITWQSSLDIREINMYIGYRCLGCSSPLSTLEHFYPLVNTGYYDWTVLVDDPINKEFLVYVVGIGDANVILSEDYSDGIFTVVYPSTPMPTPAEPPTEPIPTYMPMN